MDHLDTILKPLDSAFDDAGLSKCPQEQFMAAMEKLLTVGAFYPAQHTRSVIVGTKVQETLANLGVVQGPLRIETSNKGLTIQNIVLDASDPATKQWHRILDQLAIAYLDIEPDISSLNLHHLATAMLALKLEADSAVGFTSLDFGNLPPGISVTPRKFGLRKENEKTAEKILQTVNEVLERLGEGNPSSEGHQEYRELMEIFFTSVVERMAKDNPFGAQASNVQRPLNEILQLGSQAIEHALQTLDEGNGTLNELPRLFENAEFALSHAKDEKTVQLMVDVLQQTITGLVDDQSKQRETWVQDPVIYNLSIDQIRTEINSLGTTDEPYSNLYEKSKSEYISIYLEILTAGFSKNSFQRTTRNLAKILSGRLNTQELDTLVEGTISILQTSSLAENDNIIPYLISPIHRSGQDREARFWQELHKKGNSRTQIAMWPHTILHLLTSKLSPGHAHSIAQMAANNSIEDMAAQLPRLEALRGFQFSKFDKNYISLAPKSLHPTLSVLMESSIADNLGPLLHAGISKYTDQNLTKILMAACKSYEPENRKLYQLLLAESQSKIPSARLKLEASITLTRVLESLEGDKLEEPWVAAAIAAFGALVGKEAQPFLEKVISEKRMKMFYLWPEECRKSAQRTLDRLTRGQ